MKFKINKDMFIEILSRADRIVSKNLNLPVLSNIYIEVESGMLNIRSTNLDMGFVGSVKIKSEQNGNVLVDGQTILQFLNNLPKSDTEIEIEKEGGTVLLKTKNARGNFATMSEDDYPSIPEVKCDKKAKINSKSFVEGIRSVWYSAAQSNIRPEFSSILIFPEADNLVFVATDSFRLAEKKIQIKNPDEFEQILIPFKNAVEMVKILEDLEGEISILIDENQVAIETDEIKIVTRTIDGNFPDYKQIIPKEFTTKATTIKQDLLQAMRLSNIVSDKFGRIEIEIQKDKIKINSESQEKGKTETEISAKIEGEEMAVKFNGRHIVECLGYIQSDSVVLELNGKNKPLVIRGFNDPSFLYLVMPLNK